MNATNEKRPGQRVSGARGGSRWLPGQRELAALGLGKPGVLPLGRDFAEDGGVHGGDNVAESGLTFDRVIDRKRLTPRYGSGWRPA